jgi:hypothetical protein
MQAITVQDRDAGAGGLSLTDMPYPQAAANDVIVRVHAAVLTPGELDWPSTWTDRVGRDRTPSVPGHELSGVVAELGYGTTGLTVGQRVFGLADWTRNGSLAEYTAVEARNLAPLPADVDHTVAAALPVSGLTAWQGLFDHARLAARAGHLLRRRTRACPARGPRPAAPARAAQADHRGHTDTPGSARRVRPRPAHPRQDDHPGHRRLKGEQSCAECGLPAASWLSA